MMKKVAVAIISFIILLSCASYLHAEDTSGVQDKIKEYEEKLSQLRTQKTSLSSQIELMNTQINLATLKIQETEKKVVDTQKEIELLTKKIEGLDASLDYLSKTLLQRVVTNYKKRSGSLLTMIFNAAHAEEAINDIKYAKSSQENNQRLLLQVQTTKSNFEEQKKLREEKKIELDQLEKQLIAQKSELDSQIKQKQLLLADTQNDEKRYQQLLQQALSEFNAIQSAIVTGSKVGPVKKGDPIALVGNSGAPYCSTGAHLHFEVRVNNSWVDPAGYLAPKSLTDHQTGEGSLGSGSWDWPLSDPVIIEQHFGHTPWSWRYAYSGGIHTGIDMWSQGSEVIRAPADGTLYSSSEACSGATINIKYIDHGNGVVSFYLHVQ